MLRASAALALLLAGGAQAAAKELTAAAGEVEAALT